MTKPQLGSLTKFNSASNSVTSETINKDMQLFHFGIPLTTISENISIRTPFAIINVTGIFIGTTESAVLAFVNEINTAASVNQTQRNYTNSIGKVTQVKINNFTYVTAPNTNQVDYTLQLYDETL